MGMGMLCGWRKEPKRKPQRENKLNEICMSMSDNLVNFFKLPISRCIHININPKSKSPYASTR